MKPSLVRNSYTMVGPKFILIVSDKKATHLCNIHLPTQISGANGFLVAHAHLSLHSGLPGHGRLPLP